MWHLRRGFARGRRLLYSWRASDSGCLPRLRGRDAGIHSSVRKRAGKSASQGASASSRRLGGSRPAPVLCRLTGVQPQWWAGVFSGVKPAPLPGGRQRLDPPPTSQADDISTAAGPKPRLKPTWFQSYGFYERRIDKAEKTFQTKASSTPPDHGRS